MKHLITLSSLDLRLPQGPGVIDCEWSPASFEMNNKYDGKGTPKT